MPVQDYWSISKAYNRSDWEEDLNILRLSGFNNLTVDFITVAYRIKLKNLYRENASVAESRRIELAHDRLCAWASYTTIPPEERQHTSNQITVQKSIEIQPLLDVAPTRSTTADAVIPSTENFVRYNSDPGNDRKEVDRYIRKSMLKEKILSALKVTISLIGIILGIVFTAFAVSLLGYLVINGYALKFIADFSIGIKNIISTIISSIAKSAAGPFIGYLLVGLFVIGCIRAIWDHLKAEYDRDVKQVCPHCGRPGVLAKISDDLIEQTPRVGIQLDQKTPPRRYIEQRRRISYQCRAVECGLPYYYNYTTEHNY